MKRKRWFLGRSLYFSLQSIMPYPLIPIKSTFPSFYLSFLQPSVCWVQYQSWEHTRHASVCVFWLLYGQHEQLNCLFVWLYFGKVRCSVGEVLAAPLSGWCQLVCLCMLPFSKPTFPIKHLFAALTFHVRPPLLVCQWNGAYCTKSTATSELVSTFFFHEIFPQVLSSCMYLHIYLNKILHQVKFR